MENNKLESIKQNAISILQKAYGYCGVAESEGFVLINSGNDNEEIKIKIESKKKNGN